MRIKPPFLASVGIVFIVASTGCSANSSVEPTSNQQGGGTVLDPSPMPAPSVTASLDPELTKRLAQAKRAKEEEAADPDHITVCLAPDGTLLTAVDHDRAPDAGPITSKQKQEVCSNASAYASPGPVPPPVASPAASTAGSKE